MRQDSNERFVALLGQGGSPRFPPTLTLYTLLGNELHAPIQRVPSLRRSQSPSKIPPPSRISCLAAPGNGAKSWRGKETFNWETPQQKMTAQLGHILCSTYQAGASVPNSPCTLTLCWSKTNLSNISLLASPLVLCNTEEKQAQLQRPRTAVLSAHPQLPSVPYLFLRHKRVHGELQDDTTLFSANWDCSSSKEIRHIWVV